MSPARFGKYTVLERIGEGGFGTVYKGRDPDLKRPVAIKTLTTLDPGLRERFLREAEIAAGLQHSAITIVHDFGTEDGRPYLVQEYLPGEDLDEIIARRPPLAQTQRLDWLIQVAEALAYAHRRDVVHRDVKPGNVRVLEDGRVKLMDFGIAKLLSAPDQLTRTGMAMGTAGYLPPEQVRGEPVDRRADVFSFGALAYELLSYRRPFDGDSLSAVLYQIAHQPHPPLPEAWPGCPPRLAALIDRCLAKDPADRFDDLEPVIAELRAVRSSLAGAGGAAVGAARDAPTIGAPVGALGVAPRAAGAAGRNARDTYKTFRPSQWGSRGWAAAAVVTVVVLGVLLWLLWPGGSASGGSGQDRFGKDNDFVRDKESSDPMPAPLPKPRTVREEDPSPIQPPRDQPGLEPDPAPSLPPQPVEPDPAPPSPSASSRLLLAVAGEPAGAAATAEAALLRELAGRGHPADAPAAAGADVTSGDPRRIAAAGRRFGASAVVAGRFQGEAQPSVGRFFTGRAVLDLRVYDAAGRLLGSAAVEVGGGGGRGEMAASEMTALTAAAEEVGRKAADEVIAATAGGGEGGER